MYESLALENPLSQVAMAELHRFSQQDNKLTSANATVLTNLYSLDSNLHINHMSTQLLSVAKRMAFY